MLEGSLRYFYGVSGKPNLIPEAIQGVQNLGFMFLPNYRGRVIIASIVTCVAIWVLIEQTRLGSYLRAATDNPSFVLAFSINVPLFLTLTYALGTGLAGVLAAPIFQVNPTIGAHLIIVVLAVVVIGGLGSIMGSIITGYGLGLLEGLTKVFYPEAANIAIFIAMGDVLILRTADLFGKEGH